MRKKEKKFLAQFLQGRYPHYGGVFLFCVSIENQSQKTPGGIHTMPTPKYNWPV